MPGLAAGQGVDGSTQCPRYLVAVVVAAVDLRDPLHTPEFEREDGVLADRLGWPDAGIPLARPVSIGCRTEKRKRLPAADSNCRALTELSVRSQPDTLRPVLGAVQPPPCDATTADPTSQRPSRSRTPARTGVVCCTFMRNARKGTTPTGSNSRTLRIGL
jgi:hypothetical protein